MPLHDRILTDASCYNGHLAPVEVQFGYGPVNYRDVHIGDAIDWSYDGRGTYGARGARRVRALGYAVSTVRTEVGAPSIGCPECGCEYPIQIVEIENDQIVSARPARPGEEDELLKEDHEFIVDD